MNVSQLMIWRCDAYVHPTFRALAPSPTHAGSAVVCMLLIPMSQAAAGMLFKVAVCVPVYVSHAPDRGTPKSATVGPNLRAQEIFSRIHLNVPVTPSFLYKCHPSSCGFLMVSRGERTEVLEVWDVVKTSRSVHMLWCAGLKRCNKTCSAGMCSSFLWWSPNLPRALLPPSVGTVVCTNGLRAPCSHSGSSRHGSCFCVGCVCVMR